MKNLDTNSISKFNGGIDCVGAMATQAGAAAALLVIGIATGGLGALAGAWFLGASAPAWSGAC